ncbi:MAG: sulfotransferase [Pseudomonadota bacterium]
MSQKSKSQLPRLPNFILVGAPKCGTTALAHYLRAHPQVYFSDPKEPYFFCDDFSNLRNRFGVGDWMGYCRLFNSAKDAHVAVGEGSTLYLASDVAIRNIRARLPDAKLIAVVRDPVSLVRSFHRHLLKIEQEDQFDLRVAWQLQGSRRQGARLPRNNTVPELLQYRRIASIGSQLARFCEAVSPDRRLIVRYEQFQVDPLSVYMSVQQFLGVTPDGRQSFERINEAGAPRSRLAARALHSRGVGLLLRAGKKAVPSRYRLTMASAKERLFFTRKVAAIVDDEALDLVATDLREERQLLSDVLRSCGGQASTVQ